MGDLIEHIGVNQVEPDWTTVIFVSVNDLPAVHDVHLVPMVLSTSFFSGG